MPAAKLYSGYGTRNRRILGPILTIFGLTILVILSMVPTALAGEAKPNASAKVFPLTTKSPEARRLVDQAIVLYVDHVAQPQAIDVLREALALDPHFAMAHELLAQLSLESEEQLVEQQKAFANRGHASAAERQVIEWYQNASEHKMIPAITNMNAVVYQYPNDKLVVWMASWWLMTQTQYARALEIYQQSGITDSPGLLNNMAYNQANLRQFDQAIALMAKYAASLPGDPNPEDSFAEILRLAGQFDKSVQHYHTALAMDPTFYSAQFGLADTYSLMGHQAEARKEYKIGFEKFHLEEQQEILWKTREATTYVREADYKSADRAFQAIADAAHAKHISQVEADTYRQMAIYQRDSKLALALLDKADAALQDGKKATKSALLQESAQILRARVESAVQSGRKDISASALERLDKMTQTANDRVIECAYHGAAAAVFYSESNYDRAIEHLEEDTDNPVSLELLADSYEKSGDITSARRIAAQLAEHYDPTVEQALVVPSFRRCYQDASCNSQLKDTSLPQ